MHELGVTQEIIRLTLEHAERAGARRITDIHLVVGELSGIVDDSIRFYFDFVSRDTPAAGALLHFRHVDIRLRCRQCRFEFRPQGMDWNCPSCQAVGGEIVAGKEFYLDSIEVE